MQKKVGILTFHLAINYGAVLQCYALQEFLRNNGYHVKVIDYHPDFRKRRASKISMTSGYNIIRKIYVFMRNLMPSKIGWNITFNRFVKTKLELSSRCSALSIPSSFDSYVIGSDQLWNFTITGGPHSVFFAEFPFDKGTRKYVSYAVSMELTSVSDDDQKRMSNLLQNFDAISVREQNAVDFLENLTDKDIRKTIDPTLLVNESVWDSFSEAPSKQEKYVLLYQVRVSEHAKKLAETIAKQLGVSVVEIASGLTTPSKTALKYVTPEQFVGWFRSAECVVTTSFHGTAFSLIFKKPFYTVNLRDGWDSRVGSLLRSLGLTDRSVIAGESPLFSKVDYSNIDKELGRLRKASSDFLLNNL